MHGYSMTRNQLLHDEMKSVILAAVNGFRTGEHNQIEFDEKHSQCCNLLIDTFNKYISSEEAELTYGQS
ncbi:MAG TPA: hypothetical protein VL442_19430 [Mucilaginibacter sp.]|nr:hypothetical protein [Mucilaginibacter sp.]